MGSQTPSAGDVHVGRDPVGAVMCVFVVAVVSDEVQCLIRKPGEPVREIVVSFADFAGWSRRDA